MYGIKTLSAAVIAACMLAACGGGGGDNHTETGTGNTGNTGNTGGGDSAQQGPTQDFQGVWTGRATNTNGTRTWEWSTTSIALRDGRFYQVYSEYYSSQDPNNPNKIGGFAVGSGAAANGNFNFTGGREFNFEEAEWSNREASLNATYTRDSSMQGTVSYPGGTLARNFSANYASSYDGAPAYGEMLFNNPDNPFIQGGFYKPNPAGGSERFSVTLRVEADGSINVRPVTGQCRVTGQLTPDAARKVWEASINFHPTAEAPCPYGEGTTFSGVAFLKDDVQISTRPTTTLRRFHMVLTNPGRDQGVAFTQIQ